MRELVTVAAIVNPPLLPALMIAGMGLAGAADGPPLPFNDGRCGMKRLALLLLMMLPLMALADLQIQGPERVDPGALIRLQATGADEGVVFLWDFDPEALVDAEPLGAKVL